MKINQILIINVTIAGFFLLGINLAYAGERCSTGGSNPVVVTCPGNEICAYPTNTGYWPIGSGNCASVRPNYTLRTPSVNPATLPHPTPSTTAGGQTTRINPNGTVTTCTCGACTTTQAPVIPHTNPIAQPGYLRPTTPITCLNGWHNTSLTTCAPNTQANVFEALWNFITHKRTR